MDPSQQGFISTETMRSNRIMSCSLVEVNGMKKKNGGSYDFRSTDEIEIVKWNDNKIVKIGRNLHGAEPIGSAKKWIKGKKASLNQPSLLHTILGWEVLICLIVGYRI